MKIPYLSPALSSTVYTYVIKAPQYRQDQRPAPLLLDWPDAVEHRETLMLVGERELSPAVALRMGLNFFFGWATEDQQGQYIDTGAGTYYLMEYSLDGPHWDFI